MRLRSIGRFLFDVGLVAGVIMLLLLLAVSGVSA